MSMTIDFAGTLSGSLATVALMLSEKEVESAPIAPLCEATSTIARHALAAKRFAGKAGEIVEFSGEVDGVMRRVLLVGIGNADFKKAGGAIAAHILTSGGRHIKRAQIYV